MSAQSFADQMAPYAIEAQNATGMNAGLVLAQWGNETGWGTSYAFTHNFNPAGIGITSDAVSGQNYGSIANGVQAYINFLKGNSRYAPVLAIGPNNPQAQAVALGNSGWAAGGYNDGGGPGSSLLADMNSFQMPAGVTSYNSLAGLSSNPSDIAEYQALQAAGIGPGFGTTGPAQSAGAAPTPSPGDTSNQGDALSQITNTLQQYGLGNMANWAWGEITAGKNSDQVLIDLQTTPQFEAAFPGMAERQKNGFPAMTPGAYLTYVDAVRQAGQAAGLPQGFLDTATIGHLIGNDVSQVEAQQRITSGYEAAMNAPQETRNFLASYYGVDTGHLAAYYLDPTKAEGLLKNQLVGAEVGTQAAQSGFGILTAANANSLTQTLSSQGKINPSGSGTWDVDIGTQLGTLAPLAKLEQTMPGMGAAAPTVTQKELLDYGFLSKGQQNVQSAVETRKAFAGGGGGEDVTSAGVVGVGSASDAGNKQQGQSTG